jgi:hypothetical protein
VNLDKVLKALSEMRANSGAHDATPIALDESSVRSFDVDGRLHVATTNISKAAVNPYKGSEIPFYEELGLDKDQIYQLFRDPDELAKAANTFNNIPLLSKHVPVTAIDHHPELVIGSTGTDAGFEGPYLRNSLVVWAKPGIDDIESNGKKELSSAYRYRADMTSGEFEGQKYDGVMRDLIGNHVALVSDGRAGPDVVVGDSAENVRKANTGVVAGKKKERMMSKKKVTRQAAITLGVLGSWLRPKLAMDTKIDLGPLVKDLTAKNFTERKPKIAKDLEKLTKGKLAQDASIGEVAQLLDLIDSHDVAEDEPEIEAAMVPGETMLEQERKDGDRRLVQDDDPTGEVEAFLKDKLSGADLQHVCNIMRGGAEDVGEHHAEGEEQLEELGAATDDSETAEEREANRRSEKWSEGKGEKALDRRRAMDRSKGAKDEPAERQEMAERIKEEEKKGKGAQDRRRHAMDDPPPFKGMPKKGGGGVMDKHAMDAALKSVSEQTEKRVLETQRSIRRAEREVAPWVGNMAMDEATCADDVYGAALKALNVDTDDIHPSAWPTILKLQPLPGQRRGQGSEPRVAMDAKSIQTFNDMFPDAARIGLT